MIDLNSYLRARFGTKVYKLALDGGMTCPNRDGTCGTRGCIFCSEGGSGDFAEPAAVRVSGQAEGSFCAGAPSLGVARRIAAAKERLRVKLGRQFDSTKFIAYFQSYTNTYAPVEYLRKLFGEAIEDDSVAVLSVATRPDCLPEEVVGLLTEINRIKPVWVELGLQTVHEDSARFIRRGYELGVFEDAVARLTAAGIEVIVHVILGLPGESPEDMLETVRYVAGLAGAGVSRQARCVQAEARAGLAAPGQGVCEEPVSYVGIRGIKLQLLHIMRGTDLAELFDAASEVIRLPDGTVLPLAIRTAEEYLRVLEDALTIIGDSLVIHRLTGDAPHDKLVFPMWSANKRLVLNEITNRMKTSDKLIRVICTKNKLSS